MAEKIENREGVSPVTVAAVQVVLMRDGENGPEVFLGHRISGGFLYQWSFPGGRIDDGESNLQAACREVHEETGVEISEGSLTFLQDTQSSTVREKGGNTVLYDYRIRVFTVDSQALSPCNASPDEHSEMKWITFRDALAMHDRAVSKEQASGVSRSPDKIPGALAPRTLETIQFLSERT